MRHCCHILYEFENGPGTQQKLLTIHKKGLSIPFLAGTLGRALEGLPALYDLQLRQNKISGPLPKTWGQAMQALGTLDMGSNAFSGEPLLLLVRVP